MRKLLLCTFALLPILAFAGVYSYRDERGTLHAVSSPEEIPEQYRGKEKKLSGSESGTGEVSLKLKREGNSLLIPVTFGTETEYWMVLDTGASVSMISTRVAEKIRPKQVAMQQVATASGIVAVPVVEMPEMSVKQFSVKGLKITVNNLPKGLSAEGLLGVDWLNHFRMQIDTETGQLHLERK